MLLTMGISGFSQETTITIGTGTSTSYYAPFDNFYKNTWVQTIYPASQINNAGLITAISFNVSDVPSSAYTFSTLTIYMGTSADSVNTSTSSWLPMSDLTEVYSITNLPVPSSTGWWTFQLDNPFPYDGVDNLVIVCSKTMPEYSSSLKFYYTSVTNSCLYRQSDSDVSYASHPGSNTGTRSTYRPNLQLTMSASANFCHPVSHLTASNVTATDASFSWYSSIDATSYVLQYKTADGSWENDATSINVNDTAYDILGVLSPSTNYTARVAGICSSGDTSGWRSVSFTTACVALDQLPFQEDFDSYSTGENAYPICWAKINTYSSNRPYCNSSNHYDGVASLYFYCSSTTYNVAITPAFDESIAINGLQADFMYRANATSDRLIVGVMTDFTDINTFEPVDTIMPGSSPTTWRNVTVDFSNYQDNGHYIAFMNKNTTTNGYAYIDNLTIDLIPTCVKPQNVVLSNITVEGCDVDWTPEGDESIWEVVAVEHNADVETGTPETAYSHPFTLQGLLDDTQYDVYVRANCGGGDYSAWTFRQVFTTNPLCTPARQLTVGQVTGTSALVSWQSAEFGATGYTVGYSEAGQENWNTETVTGTQYMLSGLDPDTEYDVYVLTNCDAGQTTPVTTSFTTHCLAGGDPFTEGTITTYYVPLNNYYNYTYTQQIYLASEMGGAATLDSIAFYYNYSSPSTVKTNVTIYLGHTSQSTFSSTSNYIPSTNLTQVYTGSLNCTQGWNTFVFTTPFQYNGSDNLVLVVDDNSGDYDGSSYVFLAHNAGADRSLYFYSDSYNPDPSNPTSAGASSSTSSTRSNVKFFIPCDNTITCVAPNMYVSEVTANDISIAWVPGNTESSWELEYSEDGTIWNSEGIVSTSPYTIDNLNANTVYNIRLRAVCGGGDYSNWSTASARTACSDVTIPYTENFDSAPGSGSGNMVTCWTTGSNYTSTHYPYTSSSYHYSGGYSAYFYGTSAYYSYLASPEFDENVDMSNLQVRFYAYKTSASYYIQVGVMTDPNDPSTFVQVGQNLTPSATSTWEYIDVNTDSYTGTGRYIAFRIPAVSTSYMYVDDIEVDVIPVCLHVDNIQVTNITTTTADLSWTVGGDETEWDVVYGLAGTITDPDNETPITVSGLPETTLSGLYPSMGYDVYVRAVCSGSESSIWWHATFNTACGEIAVLPFMENFDNMGTGSTVFPNCWYRYNNYSTSTSYPYVSNSYHSSGNASLYFYSSSSTYNFAVLPAIDVNTFPINTLQVSFQMRSTSSTTSGIQVGVMIDSANISSFQPLQTVHNSTTGTFQSFEVPLTNYTGTGNRIALKLVNTSSTYSIYLDDLVVEVAPLCDKPTSVTASNLTAATADINWMPGGNETSWEMVVVPAGVPVTAGTPETVTTHPYTLTELDDNTAYDVYVRADCGTGTDFSSWSQVCHFTTTPFCSAPTDVTVSQITGTSALLTWTPAVFGANGYTIAYTETGMDSWTTQTVTGDNYMLSGLTPETAYTLTITSECDEGTAPVVTRTFTTGCLSGGDNIVGTGTSTSYNIPLNTFYNYSYVQQLYLASEINNSGDINSIGFQYIYSTAQTKNNQSIYLAETDLTSLSTWIPADSLTLVYSGSISFNNSGPDNWVTIPLTTPFNYSGTRNLVVVVKNDHGDYTTSSNNTFKTHSASGMTVQYYNDSSPFSLTSPSSASTYASRNNIKLGMECDYTVTCIAPNVYVSDASENSITLNWAQGNAESSWELETSTDNITWTPEGTVTTTPYTLTNLNPNTLYYFRLRSVCGGGEYSNWVIVSHRTDCAPIATLPFVENFDSYTGTTNTSMAVNNLPYCWSNINEGTSTSYSGYPIIYSSSSTAASGNNSVRFYTYTTSGTYDDQIAVLPAIDVNTLTMNTLQLTFDARALSTSYPFNLEIGVLTDPTDANTFTLVSTVSTQATTYANYEIPLNQYTGTGAYIAIKAPLPTANYNYGYLDNVVLDLIPACPKPTQVHASNVTTNSVDLGWTENGSATSWVIEFGPSGFTPGNGTTENATSNPYTIANLSASTSYDFYVRSECDGGEYSAMSSVYSTATACDAITALPYVEGFDAYGTGESAYPNCWTKINTYSSNRPYVNSTHYAGVGSLYFYAASSTYNIAVTPPFDQSIPVNTLQATFMYRAYSSTDYMIVGVMTNPTDANTFVPVDTIYPESTASTWVEKEVIFNNYAGSGQYIAFYNGKPSTTCYSYIDDLFIGLIPSCPKPTHVHVVSSSTTSIELGWTENGSATEWEIEYGPAGFTQGSGNVESATTNPYTINNLTASTTYDFYVRSICGAGDISYYAPVFTASTECDAISQLPYTEGFDTYGTGDPAYPSCWGKINTYSANRPYVNSTHYTGVGSLYFYAGSATYNIAIVPQFDASIPVSTLQASFMYRASSSTDYMIVGVMTNPNDASTFVPVDTVYPGSSASAWVEKEVAFSGYTGSGQYIAFYNGKPSTTCYSYIDDLVIDLIPACPKPQNVHAVNATVNSIELGWTEIGSATSWEIAYGAPGFDPEGASATTVTANTNPYTISNLTSTTTYEFYVRSSCGGGDVSYWSNGLQASTTMAPENVPYTATFDANDAWVLNNGNCTNYWAKGTVGGTAALFVTDNGTTPNYTITSTSVVAAQKLFTIGTSDSVTITFDVEVKGESSFDYMKLFLAPASAQFPASTSAPGTNDYGYNTYSTNAYNFYAHNYGGESSSYPHILNQVTGTIHVVAKMPNPNATPTSTSTALLVFAWKNDPSVGTQPPATITNLTVTTDGSSPVITNPTVTTNAATAIEQTSATLNATITNPDGVTITAKGFEWKATTGGTYTQIAGTGTGNSFTANLTGLTAGTSYTYKAFIIYNGHTAYGTEQTFTTQNAGPAPCPTPTNVTTSNITHESITVSWDADDNVSSWNLQYRPENGTLSSATSTTNSYTISGLNPQTTYEIQVQADCGNGNLSEWSALVSATTTVGINNYLENSVTLYPNPAKEYIDVRIDGDVNVTGMEVYDVYGKLINTVNVIDNMTRINVSALADGMYFVRVTTDQGMVTKRFVKK